MSSIYNIVDSLVKLEEMAEEGEISEQCYTDTFESLDGEFEDKVNAYCKLIKNIKEEQKIIGEEIKRLQVRKKAKENMETRLKNTLATAMYLTGREKVKTELFTLYGLKKDKLEITGEIPDKYKVEYVTTKPDTEAIKKLLLSGCETSFARFINSVTIR